MRARVIWGAVVAASVAAVLTGCGAPSGSPETPTASEEPDAGSDVAAAWLDDGRGIGVVTYGSSSCEPSLVAADLHIGSLTVDLADPEDAVCTADYAPRATYVPAPEGVDPSADLLVVVEGDYSGEVTLESDARLSGMPGDPTDYAPSAGWAGRGMLVILTWGSSGCPPVVESAAATGESEVTVTFETPPDDQVCTMDMAPRTTIATVDGPENPTGATLVLIGERSDVVELPIAGTLGKEDGR
ncbi:hypothetical protein [Microbacterium thalassium]|uniref:Lipoprotein n=1 Tax=Microbacterium thalassium TaxID=362649 RepID=A0A7X0FLX8_9MICO|nr:hypothetical protein [Microbacterium thalassium]MBB6389879.1 hypothetical protein [Microbacterium thalassium]GLK24566.1 hypothetical protein GCM10017607_18840 [Microbacterium thalassium]